MKDKRVPWLRRGSQGVRERGSWPQWGVVCTLQRMLRVICYITSSLVYWLSLSSHGEFQDSLDREKAFNWGLRSLGTTCALTITGSLNLRWSPGILDVTQTPSPLNAILHLKAVFNSIGERSQGAVGLRSLGRTWFCQVRETGGWAWAIQPPQRMIQWGIVLQVWNAGSGPPESIHSSSQSPPHKGGATQQTTEEEVWSMGLFTHARLRTH